MTQPIAPDEFDYARYLARQIHPDLFENIPFSAAEQDFQNRENGTDALQAMARMNMDRRSPIPALTTYNTNFSIDVTIYKYGRTHVPTGTFMHEDDFWDVREQKVEAGEWSYDDEYRYSSEIDVEPTRKKLRECVRYLKKQGYKIRKQHTDYRFAIEVDLSPSSTLRIQADRQVACVKRVVRTEEIPEQIIPATTKEIIEWDCEKISFLRDDEV